MTGGPYPASAVRVGDVEDAGDGAGDGAAARPRPPSLGSAMRLAASDLYYNSWRLAPANLIWGAILIAAMLAGPTSVIGIALLVSLAVPTAGIHRMGALIARGEPAGFSDFLGGMRRSFGAALLVGGGAIVAALLLATNVLIGLEANNPVGWFFSALALWGLVGLAMLLVAFWPILADPRREGLSLRRRLALAGLVVIGRPGRMALLTVVVAAILAASTILIAAIVLISVAYVSVLACRHVLPAVDELESRLIR